MIKPLVISPLCLLALFAAGGACKRKASPPQKRSRSGAPGTVQVQALQTPLGPAARLAVADLDGDGRPEIVTLAVGGLWVKTPAGRELASAVAAGHPNVVLAVAARGRGQALVVGWGYGRDYRQGPARVVRYRLAGGRLEAQTLLEVSSPRPQVTSIAAGRWRGREGYAIAIFRDRYHVQIDFLPRAGGPAEKLVRLRTVMGVALAPAQGQKTAQLLVARPYGDRQGSPGDAFVWRGAAPRVAIPIRGGAWGIWGRDLDGDGRDELYVTDGWSRFYRREAQARIVQATWKGGAYVSRLVGVLPGQQRIERLVFADLDGDGRSEILALGLRGKLVAFRRAKPGGAWQARELADRVRDFVVYPPKGRATHILLVDRAGGRIIPAGR